MARYVVNTSFRGQDDKADFDSLESAWLYAFDCLERNEKVIAIREDGTILFDGLKIVQTYHERKKASASH